MQHILNTVNPNDTKIPSIVYVTISWINDNRRVMHYMSNPYDNFY